MSAQTDRLQKILLELGLTQRGGKIYLFLLNKGSHTVLELSKQLNVPRTNVYRSVSKLLDLKLITLEIKDNKELYKANPIENLNLLLKTKQKQIEKKKEIYKELKGNLQKLQAVNKQSSKVLYYKGLEGLKNCLWNSINAKGFIYLIIHPDFDDVLNFNFYDKVREELVKNKVKVHELTNQTVVPSFTNVEDFLNKNQWEARHLSKKDLDIRYEIQIYNDVYVMYYFKNNEINCVEIHNKSLAQMQKQLYEYLWAIADKMKIIDKQGKSKVQTK